MAGIEMGVGILDKGSWWLETMVEDGHCAFLLLALL